MLRNVRLLRTTRRNFVCRKMIPQKRLFSVLGIETSCDDTCISVIQCDPIGKTKPKVIHSAIARSLDENEQYGGIHPIVAVQSHQKHMQSLISDAVRDIEEQGVKLDLVSVTKGPGMKASLQVGISAAEQLAKDLELPIIGIHHMQAHALTPRLLKDEALPEFPYMSLLVSGGHTLLLKSESITDHEIIASTLDIAIGDVIDKIAKDLKVPWHGLMPGAALEVWCKDEELSTNDTYVPIQASPELRKKFNIAVPLHAKVNVGGVRADRMEFSFSGVGSRVNRILKEMILSDREKRALGSEAMRCAFQHVIEKAVAGLRLTDTRPNALIISGGVARNAYLRQLMRAALTKAGFVDLELICPPLDLCSDNATMIAWTAYEMYRNDYRMPAPIVPRPKWPLNELLVQDEDEFLTIMASRDKKQPHLPLKGPRAKKAKLAPAAVTKIDVEAEKEEDSRMVATA